MSDIFLKTSYDGHDIERIKVVAESEDGVLEKIRKMQPGWIVESEPEPELLSDQWAAIVVREDDKNSIDLTEI